MTKTITQKVTFKGTSAKEIYGIFMNSKKHEAATGAPANIARKVGEKWTAHKGQLRGIHLLLKANRTVVQTWRAKGWKADSILTLQFDDTKEGCELTMVHALLTDEQAPHIKAGWSKMYWRPIKKYLKAKSAS